MSEALSVDRSAENPTLAEQPISIRAETSLADPDTCKFTVSRSLHPGGPFFFRNKKRAAGSPLGERLFAQSGHDLRALMRSGKSDAQIAAAIGLIWNQHEDRYSEIRTEETARTKKIEMSYIGG